MSVAQLERTTFETSRLLEFFSEKELQMQIGHPPRLWPLALLKELIDNALDACETAGIAPDIEVTVEADSLSVRDNGPGMPAKTIERSLDYLVRVSDKSYYVSPTRGQLGNALKCVWAAPYVATGEEGRIEIVTRGEAHTITVALDRMNQQPKLTHGVGKDGFVKNGTLIRMHWPGIAGLLAMDETGNSYSAHVLVRNYGAFNPHAAFALVGVNHGVRVERAAGDWKKWLPSDPTSPHWYTVDRLRALIAAYLSAEQTGDRARTVREFVAEFRGLSGTAKQKVVTEAAGLSGAHLRDLVSGNDLDLRKVQGLLLAMRKESRPVKPEALGLLGEAHLKEYMVKHCLVEASSVRYKKADGLAAGGVPFAFEVAFGIYTEEYQGCSGERIIGLNWSPALGMPIQELGRLLGEQRVDRGDPVVVVAHVACPRLEFTDRGKSRLALLEGKVDA